MSAPIIPFIDLRSQYKALEVEVKTRIETVLEHGRYIMGPEVEELEERLEDYVGSKHCITVASGTEALLISLMALGIKKGDEVITTPFTFIATAEVIVLLGATPVFVDVENATCNIDASLIEAKITNRTKAIIPVSLYGQPSDMNKINDVALKYDLIVIEDAAQSFGSMYNGKKSCNLSTIACTSFFPSKPLGCYGDGGAIFTDSDEIAQACREIRVHGQSKRYYHTRIGVGGRMDTIQCAILLAKLEVFSWEVEKRLSVGNYYNTLFDEAGVERIRQSLNRTSVFGQYTVLVDNRDKLIEKLKKAGVPTAVHYPFPLHHQPAYIDFSNNSSFPNTEDVSQRVLSLPMGPYLEKNVQEKIVGLFNTSEKNNN